MKKINFAYLVLMAMIIGLFGQTANAQTEGTVEGFLAEMDKAYAQMKKSTTVQEAENVLNSLDEKTAEYSRSTAPVTDATRGKLVNSYYRLIEVLTRLGVKEQGMDPDDPNVSRYLRTALVEIKSQLRKGTAGATTLGEFITMSDKAMGN